MINQVILLGNVGEDIFVKTIPGGGKRCSIKLATDEYVAGEKKTEWHDLICWKQIADVAEKMVRKGDLIHVIGYLKTRKVDTGECGNRYYTEIIVRELKVITKSKSNALPTNTNPPAL